MLIATRCSLQGVVQTVWCRSNRKEIQRRLLFAIPFNLCLECAFRNTFTSKIEIVLAGISLHWPLTNICESGANCYLLFEDNNCDEIVTCNRITKYSTHCTTSAVHKKWLHSGVKEFCPFSRNQFSLFLLEIALFRWVQLNNWLYPHKNWANFIGQKWAVN